MGKVQPDMQVCIDSVIFDDLERHDVELPRMYVKYIDGDQVGVHWIDSSLGYNLAEFELKAVKPYTGD